MRKEIYCPVCEAVGIKRKLMEVEDTATGSIYPYCKHCKKNIIVELSGNGKIKFEGYTHKS